MGRPVRLLRVLRNGVDGDGPDAVRSQLPSAAHDLRDLTADLLRHAPDAGPAAVDAVARVQITAVDALTTLATALDEWSQLLRLHGDGG